VARKLACQRREVNADKRRTALFAAPQLSPFWDPIEIGF
jgi:hypothetical protein